MLPKVQIIQHDTHTSQAIQATRTRTFIVDDRAAVGLEVDTAQEVLDSIEMSSDDGGNVVTERRIRSQISEDSEIEARQQTAKNTVLASAWWEEDDTPFKEFIRNYAKLKVHNGAFGIPARDPVLQCRGQLLNVLDWRL